MVHVIRVKMATTGVDGSSRKSNVNSTDTETLNGGASLSRSSRFDEDEPLLNLADETEVSLAKNKLLLNLSSEEDARVAADTSCDRSQSGESVSQRIRDGDYASETAALEVGLGQKTVFGNDAQVRPFSRESVSVASGGYFLGYGDPTFLNTNFPFSLPPQSHTVMEFHPNQQKSTTASNTIIAATSPAQLETSSQSANAKLDSLCAANNRWGNGTISISEKPATSDISHSAMRTMTAQVPDVTLRQPLLGPRSHAESGGQTTISRPGPTDRRNRPATSDSTSGVIVDYTYDGDNSTRLLPGNMGPGTSVMLNTFPPPGSGERGVEGPVGGAEAEEGRHYEPAVGDIHCHSGTSHHKMNDSLARRQLLIVLVLCVTFMIGETVGGVLANSLALFTDVLHLASDLISYGISLLALYLSKKKATRRMTYGYHRAEVLGALFSVFIIWLVSGVLCYIAVERIIHKHYIDVKADEMLITASLGVVFNIIMGLVLHSEKCCGMATNHAKFGHGHGHSHSHDSHTHGQYGNGLLYEYEPLDVASSPPIARDEEEDEEAGAMHQHKNINVRAAFIHVVGDIIQSVGVFVAALIIKLKEDEKYRLADPICTFVFSVLVLFTTVNVLKDTLRIIMEGAPQGVDFEQLKSVLSSLDSVVTVHNLHVWALTLDRNALSVHMAVDNSRSRDDVLKEAIKALKRHNFYHLTIQVEPYNHEFMRHCLDCQLPAK